MGTLGDGMGPTMYSTMSSFQLPLLQAIVILPKTNHEVTILDKVDFNIVGPDNR